MKIIKGKIFHDAERLAKPTNDGTGNYVVRNRQYIPPGLLDYCKVKRDIQDSMFAVDDLHIARVPVAIVNRWADEGFDVTVPDEDADPERDLYRMREIVRRLKAEGLH